MVQASADSNEGTILQFEGMVGVSGQFVGAMGTPIRGVCEVVRCHVWLGQAKGAMTDRGSTVRRPCSALLPG